MSDRAHQPWVRRAQNGVRKAVTAILDLEVQSRTIHRGTVVERGVRGLANVEYDGRNLFARDTTFEGPIKVGLCSTIHAGCELTGPVTIGAYCHLAPRCAIYAADHPVSYASMYANERLLNGAMHGLGRCAPVEISDGAWLGHGAIVLRGVAIGRGAAIGAGAVVTSSVPSYTIVAGNPARVVRPRFAEPLIEVVESSRWWELRPEQLEPFRSFFTVELTSVSSAKIEWLQALATDMALLERVPHGAE